MEKKRVGIENPLSVGEVTIIPVAKVSLNYFHGKSGLSLFCFKQPVSIVVVSPLVKRAFRITGEEVPLDELAKEVPGIKQVLEQL